MFNRLKFVFILSTMTLCLDTAGSLSVQNVTGFGHKTTTVICQEQNIRPGDPYTWMKDSSLIYSHTVEGTVQNNKYIGTTNNGKIILNVTKTNVTDAGEYTCNRNFRGASGWIIVIFESSDIQQETSGSNTKLNLTALDVYPNTSTILRVECNRSDSVSKTPYILEGNQTTCPNTNRPYLYDINWVGRSQGVKPPTGECNCTVVIYMSKVEYRKTINVTFYGADHADHHTTSPVYWIVPIIFLLSCTLLVVIYKRHKLSAVIIKWRQTQIDQTIQQNKSGYQDTWNDRGDASRVYKWSKEAPETEPCNVEPFLQNEQKKQTESSVRIRVGQTRPYFDTESRHLVPLLVQETQKEQTGTVESLNENTLAFPGDFKNVEELKEFLTSTYKRIITGESNSLHMVVRKAITVTLHYLIQAELENPQDEFQKVLSDCLLLTASALNDKYWHNPDLPIGQKIAEYQFQIVLRMEILVALINKDQTVDEEDLKNGVVDMLRTLSSTCEPDALLKFLEIWLLNNYKHTIPKTVANIYEKLMQPLPDVLSKVLPPTTEVQTKTTHEKEEYVGRKRERKKDRKK